MPNLEKTFYEDEVREGFYIPSVMKKAWAMNLEVLAQVDRVCQKYGLKYYAAYGTILGIIRHQGFIPWDDDLDIMMKRADYEKFLSVAKDELPKGWTIQNTENTDNFWNFLARVSTGEHMRFDEEHLDQTHGFPYMTGLDIFILDNVSMDDEEEKNRDTTIKFILSVADQLEDGPKKYMESLSCIPQIEKICDVKINTKQSPHELRKDLYRVIKKLCMKFPYEEDGKIGRLMPDLIHNNHPGFPTKYFDDVVMLPFENVKLPVPTRYDFLMENNYGNYIKVVKQLAGHDYPFFEKQKASLEEVMGEKFPEYQFPEDFDERQKATSFKVFVGQYCDEIKKILDSKNVESLPDAQNLAIELGNFIEEIKGEGINCVNELVAFCEALFIVFNDSSEANWKALFTQWDKANQAVEKEVLDKKLSVFMPFSAKHWAALEDAYKKELEAEDTDVLVMPIPYYYKKYDGQILDEVFDLEAYDKNLKLIDYKAFDFELNHPDKVFIQYPYDEWNDETIIPRETFSSRLWMLTEELIYVPYFSVEDFTKEHEREYYNMKYYCTMPAVVNADKVVLETQALKEVYIEKLVEFAGEETRDLWEKKIEVTAEKPGADAGTCDSLLFMVGFSDFVRYEDCIIGKLARTVDTLLENTDVKVLWQEDPVFTENKKLINEKLLNEYENLVEKFTSAGGTYIKGMEIVDQSQIKAFYGSPSTEAYKTYQKHKPTMIWNVYI